MFPISDVEPWHYQIPQSVQVFSWTNPCPPLQLSQWVWGSCTYMALCMCSHVTKPLLHVTWPLLSLSHFLLHFFSLIILLLSFSLHIHVQFAVTLCCILRDVNICFCLYDIKYYIRTLYLSLTRYGYFTKSSLCANMNWCSLSFSTECRLLSTDTRDFDPRRRQMWKRYMLCCK